MYDATDEDHGQGMDSDAPALPTKTVEFGINNWAPDAVTLDPHEYVADDDAPALPTKTSLESKYTGF